MKILISGVLLAGIISIISAESGCLCGGLGGGTDACREHGGRIGVRGRAPMRPSFRASAAVINEAHRQREISRAIQRTKTVTAGGCGGASSQPEPVSRAAVSGLLELGPDAAIAPSFSPIERDPCFGNAEPSPNANILVLPAYPAVPSCPNCNGGSEPDDFSDAESEPTPRPIIKSECGCSDSSVEVSSNQVSRTGGSRNGHRIRNQNGGSRRTLSYDEYIHRQESGSAFSDSSVEVSSNQVSRTGGSRNGHRVRNQNGGSRRVHSSYDERSDDQSSGSSVESSCGCSDSSGEVISNQVSRTGGSRNGLRVRNQNGGSRRVHSSYDERSDDQSSGSMLKTSGECGCGRSDSSAEVSSNQVLRTAGSRSGHRTRNQNGGQRPVGISYDQWLREVCAGFTLQSGSENERSDSSEMRNDQVSEVGFSRNRHRMNNNWNSRRRGSDDYDWLRRECLDWMKRNRWENGFGSSDSSAEMSSNQVLRTGSSRNGHRIRNQNGSSRLMVESKGECGCGRSDSSGMSNQVSRAGSSRWRQGVSQQNGGSMGSRLVGFGNYGASVGVSRLLSGYNGNGMFGNVNNFGSAAAPRLVAAGANRVTSSGDSDFDGEGEGPTLSFEEQEKIYNRQNKAPEVPADPVSVALAYKKFLEPLQRYANSGGRGKSRIASESSLSFGPRRIPADGRVKKVEVDVPEEKLNTVDKPIVEFKPEAFGAMGSGSRSCDDGDAALAEQEAMEREEVESCDCKASPIVYTMSQLGYGPVSSNRNTFVTRSSMSHQTRSSSHMTDSAVIRVPSMDLGAFGTAGTFTSGAVEDESPCGPIGPPLPGYQSGDVIYAGPSANPESPISRTEPTPASETEVEGAQGFYDSGDEVPTNCGENIPEGKRYNGELQGSLNQMWSTIPRDNCAHS